MASDGSGGDEQRPWGRFTCVSKSPATEHDHLCFSRRHHRIGRDARYADILVESVIISKRHCEITLTDAAEEGGTPVVTLLDLSFNGVYVNEVRVGKGNSVVLEPNATVHFTRPGFRGKAIEPIVFKFELLPDSGRENRLDTAYTKSKAPASGDVGITSQGNELPPTQATPASVAQSTEAPNQPSSQELEAAAAAAAVRGVKKRSADAANLDAESTRSAALRSVRSNSEKQAPARPDRALREKSVGGGDGDATLGRGLPPTQALSPSASFLRPTHDGASVQQNTPESVNMNVDTTGVDPNAAAESTHSWRHDEVARVSAGGGDDDVSSRRQELSRDLEKKLQEAENRVGQLTQQLSDAEQELISLTDKLDKCHKRGKQLEDELNHKRMELEARDKLVAQLTEERLAMKAELEDAHKKSELQEAKLRAADQEIKSLSSGLKKAKVALKSTTAVKSTDREAEIRVVREEGLRLKSDESAVRVKADTNGVAESSVSDEADELKDVVARACVIFKDIHQRLSREQTKLKQIPGIRQRVEALEQNHPSSQSPDLSSIADGLGEVPSLTDQSLLSSERSLHSTSFSSDVHPGSQQGVDDEMGQEEIGSAPFSTDLSAPEQQQHHPEASSSQDADGSEAHSAPSIQSTPTDQHRHDSEDSVLSGHSSSKTPPAKPIRVQSRTTRVAAPSLPDSEDIVVADEEDEEDEEKNDSAQTTGVTSVTSSANKAAASDKAGETGEDGAGGEVVAEAAADEQQQREEEVEEEVTMTHAEIVATEGGDEGAKAQKGNAEVDETKEHDDDAKQEGEPAGIAARLSTEPQLLQQEQPPRRWLPTLTHDENMDSQANDTSIFDNETQFSQ